MRRSILADAGITTPKQIAKSLVQFSKRRSDLQFSALVIPQIQSELKRSKPVRGVLEALIRSKKYAVPLAVIYPWIAVGGGVAYITGGRFNPEKHVTSVYEPKFGFKSASRAEANGPEPAESDARVAADFVTASPVPEMDPNGSLFSD